MTIVNLSMTLLVVIFSCFLIGAESEAQKSVSSDTALKYNEAAFNKNVPTSNHFILYFAPWSSECKGVAGIWEELGLKYNNDPESDVVIAKVDCTVETSLCLSQDVTDYPTVKFYKTGGEPGGSRHRGVMDTQSLEQFMNMNIGKETEFVYGARVTMIPEPKFGLHKLQDENFDEIVASGAAFVNFCTPWSSKCMDLKPVFAALAKEYMFESDILFGEVDCSMHKTTCNENEVRGYPSLLWLVDGIVEEKYPTKNRDLDSLRDYVFKKLGKKPNQVVPDYDEEEGHSDIYNIEKNELQAVIKKEKLLFVQFWTAWSTVCQELDPGWEGLATYFHDTSDGPAQIKIAKFDCSRFKEQCEEAKIEEFPTLNLYRNGKLETEYKGKLKLDDMIDYVNNVIAQKDEL